MDPNCQNRRLYKRNPKGSLTQIRRRKGNMIREAKIGVMGPQAKEAKECPQPPADGRGKEGFPLMPLESNP